MDLNLVVNFGTYTGEDHASLNHENWFLAFVQDAVKTKYLYNVFSPSFIIYHFLNDTIT